MRQRLTDIRQAYRNERNTLARAVKDYAADRIEIEIGDSKQDEFFPQAKIKRWNNEVNLSIRRDNGARRFRERNGQVVADSQEESVVIYELEPDEQNEDGGLEIEIELPRRPKTNVFDFTIQTKGLAFYYQPPLTEQEKAQGATRPENVEGSYAVYHATKRDNFVGGKEYKTGKAFHIYRPKAIDADGAEVWCELAIDEQAGILTVTVPQNWLDTASYPVRVDPTVGYTSLGASLTGYPYSLGNVRTVGDGVTLTTPSQIQSLSAGIRKFSTSDTNTDARFLLSENSSSATVVATSSVFSNNHTSAQWETLSVDHRLDGSATPDFYRIGVQSENANFVIAYDAAPGDSFFVAIGSFVATPPFSLSWSLPSSFERILSLYATYANILETSHTTNTLVRKRITPAHETDTFVIKIEAPTHSSDCLVRTTAAPLPGNFSYGGHYLGGFGYAAGQFLFPVDTILLSHVSDALIRERLTEGHYADALVRKRLTATHSSDAFVVYQQTANHTADTFVLTRTASIHSSDAHVVVPPDGQTADHGVDSLVRAVRTASHASNALVRGRETDTHTSDGLVRLRATSAHSTDAWVLFRDFAIHSSDVLVLGVETTAHTADVDVKEILTATHSSDSYIAERVSHYTDAFVCVPWIGKARATSVWGAKNRATSAWTPKPRGKTCA